MRTTLRYLLDAWTTALALFAAAGVLRGALPGGDDWTWIWIQGTAVSLPPPLRTALVLLFAGGVLVRRPPFACLGRCASGVLALVALSDAAGVAAVASRPLGLRHGFPVPESLLTAGLLALHAGLGPATWPAAPALRAVRVGLVLGTGLLGVLGHMAIVGATTAPSYPSAIVVLGAKVHPDGRPSGALEDRVATACDVFHAATPKADPFLVLSGGADPGAAASEVEVMARLCRDRGVPEGRILLDPEGASTRDSAHSVARLARRHGWREVAVVSHDYHLARVQAAFRAAGLRARGIPCRETHAWPGKPLAVLREVAALAAYLLDP